MEEMELNEHQEIERKANGSQVFNETYSPEAIARLKSLVQNFYNQGERKFYSIHVDGETVVPRNSDSRKFNRYLPFVSEHTKKVEVKMYQGHSPKCNTYIFFIHKGLSGAVAQPKVDVQAEISRALKEQENAIELKRLKEQVEKKNKKIEKLKGEIEGHSSWNPDNVGKILTKGLNAIGQISALRNGTGVHGVPQNTVEPDSEVEVQFEGDEEESKSTQIFKDMLATYGEDGMKNALGWLTVLAAHPELQDTLRQAAEELTENEEEEDGEA